MIINHNIPALNTYRSLTINNENTSKSLSKLSSGLRITSAGDDAAGLAISEKMRSQIRGLGQASRNAYDGKSLLAVAEGALNEVHSILQRMKELSVQSANDTNTTFDRAEIQKEVEQLKTEIDRISRDTEFNTMKLLNGTMAATATAVGVDKDSGSVLDPNFSIDVVGAAVKSGFYTLSSSATNGQVVEIRAAGGGNGVITATNAATMIAFSSTTNDVKGNTTGLGAQFGNYRLDISQNLGGTFDYTLTGPDGKYQVLQAMNSAINTELRFDQIGVSITLAAAVTGDGYVMFSNKADFEITLKNSDNQDVKISLKSYSGGNVNIGGLQFKLTHGLFTGTDGYKIAVADNSIKLHIGANQGQNMNISILDSSTKALGVNLIDLTEQKEADKAISTVDKAINRVSSERSKMGAIVNRLEHTISNLGVASENMSAAESRIRDVDMAKEIMEFTKNQILSQAAQSMLAQANALPQGILQLLQ
jgi:flagellin